jgi:isocitrate dehydrogenase (NAD+)
MHRVTLIPGDGIGPEVIGAAQRAIDATGVAIEWDRHDAGAELHEREGDPLPVAVLESIRERGVALKGPTATPAGSGFRSVNLALRRELGLFAGIRPCKTYAGVPGARPGMDVVIVRMNLEDLYAGIEYERSSEEAAALRGLIRAADGIEIGADAGFSIKPLSVSQCRRVAREAFEYARAHDRERVTAVHKATVMRHTDGLFLQAAAEIAGEYPDIAFDDRLVDTAAAELVTHPERSDVIVTPLLYGDILSDVAAALVGGLGMAPGMNVGDGIAVFEAVHGSAPKHRAQDRANPSAAILSGVMLLRRLGEEQAAGRLERALAAVIADGRSLTYDLRSSHEGAVGTRTFTEAIVSVLSAPRG